MIVQANDVYDVIRAVKLARRENWRVAVRSGGHSWAGNHIRDGGMLLDVSRLDDARIDKHALRATAGPGCTGAGLAMRLLRQGLFFPAGHCRGVCLGGYLLQGGYGWHSRVLGPACMSVEGIDVVTADGELIHASADENADLYWSARGAGPGFFGVVTRFHLRLYRRPKLIGAAVQTFSIDKLEEVFRWAHGIRREVPAAVELMLLLSRDTPGVRGPGILAIAPVFADSWRAAWDAASFLTHGPLRRRASLALPFVPTGLNLLYTGVMQHYPADHRYAVDNMWTGASFDDLLPGLRRIAETLPAAPSHALWMNWVPPPSRPDMAYSMEDEIYLALYSVWKDAKDDAAFAQWPVERMREMQHLCSGCQLADENLGQRPVRFVSDEHLARLDRIRAERDPQSRFFPWMGRPNV
ncbi:MAG: FAD-binding oxidoreductase [Planctomycetia bacterium]|nr:FAD-binding oxidoreductase [Planctomycetia bacterium]